MDHTDILLQLVLLSATEITDMTSVWTFSMVSAILGYKLTLMAFILIIKPGHRTIYVWFMLVNIFCQGTSCVRLN